jgi:hypothetical protein
VRRLVSGALIAVIAVVSVLALAGPPAGAQQAPPDDASCDAGSYPPPTPHLEPGLRLALDGGQLQPGTSSGSLTLLGAQPGGTYSGMVFATSTIDVPAQAADGSGTVHFSHLVVPQSFQLDATHVIYVFRDGCLAGSFDPCIGAGGRLYASCPSGVNADKGARTLPRTGMAHLAELLRAAALAFAAGTLLLYARRRRVAKVVRA